MRKQYLNDIFRASSCNVDYFGNETSVRNKLVVYNFTDIVLTSKLAVTRILVPATQASQIKQFVKIYKEKKRYIKNTPFSPA